MQTMEKEIISHFQSHDYVPAVLGGLLISSSISTNLFFKGRKTSVSNWIYDMIKLQNFYPKFVFLLGMIWVSTFLKVFYSQKLDLFEKPATNTENLTIIGYIVSGFLLGLGSKLAGGDDTEHALAGIPRLSKRSFTNFLFVTVASLGTATFNSYFGFTHKLSMGGGETTYFQMLKNKLTPKILNPVKPDIDHTLFSNTIQAPLFYATTALVIMLYLHDTFFRNKTYDFEVSLISGILFGAGCIVGGLTNREKVLQGLSLNSQFDSSLLILTATTIITNFIMWNVILNVSKKPIFSENYDLPRDDKVDLKLIIGSILFGVAVGISGFCVGPSIVSFTVYFPRIAVYLLIFLSGQFLGDIMFEEKTRTDVKQTIEKKVE